jgi:two-component system chemotaxis response regulator CheB
VIRLLVVEDSALMRKLMAQVFSSQGDFELAFAKDGVEALATIGVFKPHVVTLDVHMPNMDGLTCLDRIMLQHPCPVVMVSSLTAEGAEETLAALEAGAVDFIAKPSRAISLEIDSLAPRLIEKVRLAATARPKRSHRLAERVRARQVSVEPNQLKKSIKLPITEIPPSRSASPDGLVLIGTSTGGPPALDIVLSGLPANYPWPISRPETLRLRRAMPT